MTTSDKFISYKVTPVVYFALFLFALLNTSAILQIRGVADPQGYILNTSKPIPVNTYEDDAQVSIMHAFWYFGDTTNTFDVATNFGGPLLHLAKPVMWLGTKLGWIKRFDDRYLYVLYPSELTRVFKLFAFYKLALLIFLPLSIFWLMNNFFSRRSGELAVWFILGMPFLTAFELRLKPEGVVFALTMLSLLHLFAFQRSPKPRHLFLAVSFFMLGAAMKFTMATAIFLLPICFASGIKKIGRSPLDGKALRLLTSALGFGLIVFMLSNPRIIPGLLIFTDFIQRYTAIPSSPGASDRLISTLWFRLIHYEPLLGKTLGLLALPALGFASVKTLTGRLTVTPWSCLTALYFLQMFFLWKVAHNHVILNLTYYYYSQALLTIILIALFIDEILEISSSLLFLHVALWSAVLFIITYTLSQNLLVLNFLSGPSTRQMAQEWIERHIPVGASIGLPIPPQKHLTFNDRFLVDPFQHRILPIGPTGEETNRALPEYVLWVRMNPLQSIFSNASYEQIAYFDTGKHLPREAFNFYQDDIYEVYRRTTPATGEPSIGPADADTALGVALRNCTDTTFNLIQYHASGIFPLEMTVLFHAEGRYLPFGRSLFMSAVRHESSPVAYLHQLTPELMTLWGIKYIWARNDSSLTEDIQTEEFSILQPLPLKKDLVFQDDVRLYVNQGYKGMAHFLPSPPAELRSSEGPRWLGLLDRHKVKPYGFLFSNKHALPTSSLLRVRMSLDCEGSMDLLLKGGGKPVSLLLGPGHNEVDFPLKTLPGILPAYELNSASLGASCIIRNIQVEPMVIESAQSWSASTEEAFASVDATSEGHVIFSLPFHPYWKATVDGTDCTAERGPGNTVAVPVSTGHHLVCIRYNRS